MTRQTKSTAAKSERSNPRTGTENHSLHPCLWMQAGVVRGKKCFKNFNCATCRFYFLEGQIKEKNPGKTALHPPHERGYRI